jgi:hypothetical protein
VDQETKVWLVETQSAGSLGDIEVGDRVLVRGRRAEGSTPEAPIADSRAIVVAPDGDEVHGQVTGVEGNVITLATRQPVGHGSEEPEGVARVATTGETEFRLGRQPAGLEDVTEGKYIVAFGEAQEDGSLLAALVVIDNRPPPPARPLRGLRGEVTAVSDTGLTLLTRNDVSVRVNVDQETKVWLVETQSAGSLGNIEAGDRVLVRGRRAEGSTLEAPVADARVIVVGPAGDRVHGRVTGVAGNVITLATRRPEGEITVVTDGETEFRRCALRRRCHTGSLEDVTEGRFVVAFGEAQDDGDPQASLQAGLVFISARPWGDPGRLGATLLPDAPF